MCPSYRLSGGAVLGAGPRRKCRQSFSGRRASRLTPRTHLPAARLTAAILGGDHWDARVYALLAVGVVRALPAGEDWREVWGRRCRRAPGPSGQPGWLIVSLGMLDAA